MQETKKTFPKSAARLLTTFSSGALRLPTAYDLQSLFNHPNTPQINLSRPSMTPKMTERQKDREITRQRYKKKERREDKMMKIQKNEKTER